MKFDSRTIQILRNFSTINPSMVFKPGNTVSTISQSKSIMAKAKVATQFETNFGIYDLSQFLGVVTMFEDPELITTERSVDITQGRERLSYTYSETSLLLAPPDKAINIPTPEVQFGLKNDVLVRTMKALSIIGAPEIAVRGDGSSVFFEAINSKNPSESMYSVNVGDTKDTFRLIFRAENIKLLPDDYTVEISSKGISHFTGSDVEYWITLEQSSTFER